MPVSSQDLRKRVIDTIERGDGSLRQIAQRFLVSLSFVVRLLRHDRTTGSLEPNPHGGGRPPALGPAQLERLAALIRKKPVATLEEVRQGLGVDCSTMGERPRPTRRWRLRRALILDRCVSVHALDSRVDTTRFSDASRSPGSKPGSEILGPSADLPSPSFSPAGGRYPALREAIVSSVASTIRNRPRSKCSCLPSRGWRVREW
jgi:hypothetical protein